ncbi:hypothetical protein C8R44DRAFT_990653 [Mycena epipterygia]|nr:hypothetical protein C8R44DRAFT_990653 [Mycena epipterygia]
MVRKSASQPHCVRVKRLRSTNEYAKGVAETPFSLANALPDEIISEILCPVLKIPEDIFSDTSLESPFATHAASWQSCSGAVLLVCKAWLRVSTPLLYNIVVLRSKAQAGALAAALKRNKDFGRFIMKLRVEGGFGTHMHQILKLTPNVTDIVLSSTIHSPDTTSGLVLGLPLLNPTRLILLEDTYNRLRNKSVVQLFEALANQIHTHWINLTTLVISNVNLNGPGRQKFKDAICSSKTLKIISLPHSWPLIDFVNKLASIQSLQAIEIRSTPQRVGGIFTDYVAARPVLTQLVRFSGPEIRIRSNTPTAKSTPISLPPADPTFRPMASEPQSVIDRVWQRVLFFAMIGEKSVQKPMDIIQQYYHFNKINSNRLNFVLVSKTFYRLAIPYLYGYPTFSEEHLAREFAYRLAADPALGLHVREMNTRKGLAFKFYGSKSTTDLLPIFCRTPHLTKLVAEDGISMQWNEFEALAQTAGQTLQEFAGYDIEKPDTALLQLHPAVFAQFTALRSFQWNSPIVFAAESVLISDPPLSAASLPALEFLVLESPGLFAALAQFDLPNLRHLTFGYKIRANNSAADIPVFLSRHGPKLTHLKMTNWAMKCLPSSIFELCPVLAHLHLDLFGQDGDEDFPPVLAFPPHHQSLAKLVVSKSLNAPVRRRSISIAQDQKEWTRILDNSSWSHFPALHEIQASPFEWPATTEHAISKSPWVKWSKRLLGQGIKLTDEEGTSWRTRLEAPRR